MNSLPTPKPKMLNNFGAIISAESLVKHIVALQVTIKHYNTDDNWKDKHGKYEGGMYERLHKRVNKMKEKGEIPDEIRTYLLRIWLDAF